MHAEFFVAAESCVTDARSNQLSVFNIVEEISTTAFPAVIPKLVVAGLFRRTQDEPAQIEVRLKGRVDQVELFDVPLSLDFQDKLRIRGLGEFQGFLVPGPGEALLTIINGEREIARWVILIRHVGPQIDLFAGNPPAAVANPGRD